MPPPNPAKTLTVSIGRPADDVYTFVSNPENLPAWAKAFCQSVMRVGGSWIIRTPTGDVGLRFIGRNPFRVCDHYVTPGPGVEIYVPMRVLENGAGSEVMFTLFRQPEMTQDAFERDLAMVERDLATLKAVLEG